MSSPSVDYTESRVPEILIGTIVPTVIATIFVFARLYSRAFLTRSLGQDDAWISFSWAASLAFSILDCLLVNDGFGYHLSVQNEEQKLNSLKLSYVIRLLYQLVISTTKVGICAFYLRVFRDRRSRLLIYLAAAFVCAYTVPLELYVVIQCRPGLEGPLVSLCHKNAPDLYIFSICNILADTILLVFVVPRIIPLKMPWKQKSALLAVISLGMLVVVAAICRLVFALQFNESNDKTWDIATITTWSAVEINTGLFCASAPATKPLIRKLTPRFLSSTLDSLKDGTSRQRNFSHRVTNQTSKGIELGSGTDLNMASRTGLKDQIWTGGEEVSNKAWHGETESKGAHWDDSNSEEAIVGGIVKTVSVAITNTRGTSKDSMDRNKSVGKFEPV